MTDLLPCPFCGGEARLIPGPLRNRFGTVCDDCLVWRDDRHDTEVEAIAAWNTRTPPQITDAMVKTAIEAYGHVLPEDGDFSDAMRAALTAALGAQDAR